MPWFWTDDLAHMLIDQDGCQANLLSEWTQRPAAWAVPEGTDALDFARDLLAGEEEAVA
jgi:hypothetical protein